MFSDQAPPNSNQQILVLRRILPKTGRMCCCFCNSSMIIQNKWRQYVVCKELNLNFLHSHRKCTLTSGSCVGIPLNIHGIWWFAADIFHNTTKLRDSVSMSCWPPSWLVRSFSFCSVFKIASFTCIKLMNYSKIENLHSFIMAFRLVTSWVFDSNGFG